MEAVIYDCDKCEILVGEKPTNLDHQSSCNPSSPQPSTAAEPPQAEKSEDQKAYELYLIKRGAKSLKHASKCKSEACSLKLCHTFKQYMGHLNVCRRTMEQCKTRSLLKHIASYHIEICDDAKCELGFCVQHKQIHHAQQGWHRYQFYLSKMTQSHKAYKYHKYECGQCKRIVSVRFHCTTCKNYDLCMECKNEVVHEHKLIKLGLEYEPNQPSHGGKNNTTVHVNPSDIDDAANRRFARALIHSSECKIVDCSVEYCMALRGFTSHNATCRCGSNTTSSTCKEFLAFSYFHSKYCMDDLCEMPYCTKFRSEATEKGNEKKEKMVSRKLKGDKQRGRHQRQR